MKKDKALNAVEYIDPGMIDEAEIYKGKRNTWIRWGAAAACLCICLAGAASLYPALLHPGKDAVAGHGIEDYNEPAPGGLNYLEIPAAENTETDPEVPAQANTKNFMIGHYDKSLNDADMAVNNGHCELSNSLKAALGEYNDTVKYRVVVEVFRDGTVIDSGSSEVALEEARLAKEKYTVAHETYEDTAERSDYFTIHAEADQLLHFSVNESYGYCISLYDEYLGLAQPMESAPAEFSMPSNTADAPVDESSAGFIHAAEYPAEVFEIQQAVSDAMARGDLPYVYESAVYENPLRIEVKVNTSDAEQIEAVKKYDPTGKYLVVVQGERNIQDEKEIKPGGAYAGN